MGKRVLIVDDSSMMRKMIAKMLEPVGFEVVGQAKNGREAIELYQALQPDIVTMDITMRDMDGITAAKEILRLDGAAKIFFLSNLEEERYRTEVEELGALGFATKHRAKDVLALIDP